MSVKITRSITMAKTSWMDYRININGVSIGLSKDDFKELCEKLKSTLLEDYNMAYEANKKYENRVDMVNNFKKDIVPIFWDGDYDDMDAFLYRKETKDVDEKKLQEVLDKYSDLLELQ